MKRARVRRHRWPMGPLGCPYSPSSRQQRSGPGVTSRHTLKRWQPCKTAAVPDLPRWWAESVALVQTADPQRIRLGMLRGAGEHGTATVAAKGMHPLGAAVCGLDVFLKCSSQQAKRVDRGRNVGPEGRSGLPLAVSAVAEHDRSRLHVGFVGDGAAMALTVDFHGVPFDGCGVDERR